MGTAKFPDCAPLDMKMPANEIPLHFKSGGQIPDGGVTVGLVNSYPLKGGAFSKLRVTGTVGTLAVLSSDVQTNGTPICYPIIVNVLGQYHPSIGIAVVSAGFDMYGNAIETTCTGIYWYGGM